MDNSLAATGCCSPLESHELLNVVLMRGLLVATVPQICAGQSSSQVGALISCCRGTWAVPPRGSREAPLRSLAPSSPVEGHT